MFDIKEELKKLPECPGVYLHKDASGQIIYVGKAVNLSRRVHQYFQSPKNMHPKVAAMVSHVASFEYIRCKTEVDALILENRLIKQYQPQYNILLRDDKTYPYIKLTVAEDYPRLVKTRRAQNDGSRYFGPYPWVGTMDMVIELLNTFYKLKRCTTTSFPENFRPCLNYHIDRCEGMCIGLVDKDEYRSRIEKVTAFLDGDDREILQMLKDKMQEASDNMEYEEAAAYRDYIEAVKEMNGMLKDPEKAKDPQFAFIREKERLAGLRTGLAAVFGNDLAEKIHRVESYDISNLNGLDSVGGMVVFYDGKPQRKAYRRFKIKTVEGADDTGSLQEVLFRRFKEAKKGNKSFTELPDLILMDGGLGQVHAAEAVLNALGFDIPIAGMAKDDKHRTRALIYKDNEYPLRGRGDLFAYCGAVQEEVHRFAIEYHHKLRTKNMVHSVLDDAPGIGEKRKMALLTQFKSVEAIKNASVEELAAVQGMTQKSAEQLHEYFACKNKA